MANHTTYRKSGRNKREADLRARRRELGLSQADFWARVGVTQSGGSRYEHGRKIPKPAARLLTLAFGTERQVRRCMAYLRSGR